MCNLGEILELEAIKSERVRNIKSIMTKLKMSFKEAIAFLEIPEDEEKEIEDFAEKLEKQYPEIYYVNRLITHSWGQKVIRFYDLDGNLIEVGTPV